jgi:outer membrane protein assembly factor BamB
VIAGGAVVVGTRYGELHAAAPADGKRRWARLLGGAVHTPLAAAEDRVYTAGTGWVYALDARDGAVVWLADTGREAIEAGPTLGAGQVFVATQSGAVLALDAATGEARWKQSLGQRPAALVWAGDRLLAAGESGRLACLDPAQGEARWERPGPLDHGGSVVLRHAPAIAGDVALVSLAYPGVLAALSLGDGASRWAFPHPSGGGFESTPHLAGSAILVVDGPRDLLALGAPPSPRKAGGRP